MSVLEVVAADVAAGPRVVVTGATFGLDPGESLAVMGPSGSGKTSLLHAVAGISPVTAGRVVFNGVDLAKASTSERDRVRLSGMGLVFQFGELLPELSAVENVALPSRYLGRSRDRSRDDAEHWLGLVGLPDVSAAHPDQLSGGQIQRAAIARAMAHGPRLVLADEPTGMLDAETSDAIAALLFGTVVERGAALVIVTHDPAVAECADRVALLEDGRLRFQ